MSDCPGCRRGLTRVENRHLVKTTPFLFCTHAPRCGRCKRLLSTDAFNPYGHCLAHWSSETSAQIDCKRAAFFPWMEESAFEGVEFLARWWIDRFKDPKLQRHGKPLEKEPDELQQALFLHALWFGICSAARADAVLVATEYEPWAVLGRAMQISDLPTECAPWKSYTSVVARGLGVQEGPHGPDYAKASVLFLSPEISMMSTRAMWLSKVIVPHKRDTEDDEAQFLATLTEAEIVSQVCTMLLTVRNAP